MKLITKKIVALFVFYFGTTVVLFAQVTQQKIGNNPTLINPSAALEIESTNKGALLPRVALTSLTDAVTIPNPADALTVFNTATSGIAPNNVTPGYYYWKRDLITPANSKWIRLASATDLTEPWRIQATTTDASDNSQNIYQSGKVAVGDFSSAVSTKQMEVKGDFKSEKILTNGVVGTEVGSPLNPNGAMHYWLNGTDYRTASANDFSATLEAKTGNTTNTIAAGNTQSEMSSQNGTNSLSIIRTTNSGNFFMETFNVAEQFGSTFSLLNDGVRLVHSNTNGISNPFLNNNRTELFLQKENGIRFNFRNALGDVTGDYWFPTTTGTNGQVMTQTASGRMVWANPSSFGTANNGLTKNATTGVFELGGDLNRPTTIATTISGTTYPLNITGLPADGAMTDNIIVASTGGQLKTISGSAFTNIYTANGSITSGAGTRILNLNGSNLTFTGTHQRTIFNNNSGLIQEGLSTSPLNDAFIQVSSPNKDGINGRTNLYLQAFDGGAAQIFAGEDAKSLTIGTHFTAVPAPIIFTTNQVGSTISTEKMRLTPAGNLGLATNLPTEKFDVGSGNLRVRDINSNTGIVTDKVVVADPNGVLKTIKAAMPKFFYMPSITIPTHNSSGVLLTGTQTINLYQIYSNQYGFSGLSNQARSSASATLPVLPANELDYFITYFDSNVFSNVSVSAAGVLTYQVLSTAVVTPETFMNIVFKVKD